MTRIMILGVLLFVIAWIPALAWGAVPGMVVMAAWLAWVMRRELRRTRELRFLHSEIATLEAVASDTPGSEDAL